MFRYLIFALSMLSFAMTGPSLLRSTQGDKKSGGTSASSRSNSSGSTRISRKPPSQPAYNNLAGRTARARRSSNGHYEFTTRMNGARVEVLVDTGAGGVAINESTARRLGIRLQRSDFKYKSSTANGITHYAAATIREIRIGRIILRDVRAAVLRDKSLNVTLLGMSFLNRLKKFEFSNGTLILTQ